MLTNQYSVTEYKTESNEQGLPGMFFRYDIEPILVRVTEEKRTTFIHFIVRMCGILGGTFLCVGALHNILLTVSDAVNSKKED